jgi:ABC-type dipeptide/oligopeptide/nickel transport system permease subunit
MASQVGVGPPVGLDPALAPGTASRDATLWADVWKKLRRDWRFILSAVLIVVFLLMGLVPRLFTGADPKACNILNSALKPSGHHWFGTDLLGCDYYSRVIYGARTSLIVGFLTAGSTVLLALLLGSIAGYYGGVADGIISRFADVWFSIPTILGAVLLLTLLHGGGPVQVSLVLILFGWPDLMRLLRSTVVSGKERGYVRASRAMGASDFHILTRHVLPNGIAPLIVYGAYGVGAAIAGEAALTFLGVGLRLPTISWGLQISVAQDIFFDHPHLLFFPSLFLSVLVGAFILLGETLRDALDPRVFGRE